jgi:hypothetical protein
MTGVALAFVGDVCLAGGVRAQLARFGAAHPFEHVQTIFAGRDLVCGNLECCFVDRDFQEPSHNVMLVPAAAAEGLGRSGIGVWSLSNNHVMDAGPDGLAATVRSLEDGGMRHFGAGSDMAQAERDVTIDVRGRRVTFIGACDVPRYFATSTAAGIAPLVASRVLPRVADARKRADIVVCVLHADLEFSEYPTPARVRLSRTLIEQGADLVIAHHPHVCQGIERYRAGLIAYSLGNFVFPLSGNVYQQRYPATAWGTALCIDVEWRGNEKSLAWRNEPVTIGEDNRPAPSRGDARNDQLATLARLSDRLADRTVLRHAWWKRCLEEARATYYVLHHRRGRVGLRSALGEALQIIRDPYERRWIYGLLTGGSVG